MPAPVGHDRNQTEAAATPPPSVVSAPERMLVVNNIEVLPAHSGDDEIRINAYIAVFGSSALERYAPGGQLSGAAINELKDTGLFGLEGTDVGRGPHAIHIIVNGARVLLLGQVRTKGDRQIAEASIRSLPGVLAVTNQLRVTEK